MNNCKYIDKNIAYFDELQESEKKLIFDHIKSCERCSKAYNQFEIIKKGFSEIDSLIKSQTNFIDWDKNLNFIMEKIKSKEIVKRPSMKLPDILFLKWKYAMAGLLILIAGFFLGVFYSNIKIHKTSYEIHIPSPFFEKMNKMSLKKDTENYLRTTQLILMNFLDSYESNTWDPNIYKGLSKEMTMKKIFVDKKLLNSVGGGALFDKIELILIELSKSSNIQNRERLEEIYDYIKQKRILLKLQIVNNEIKNLEI
ncbi:MAG: hypothetical protein AB1410_01230 [Acidobacteriota bacterium]